MRKSIRAPRRAKRDGALQTSTETPSIDFFLPPRLRKGASDASSECRLIVAAASCRPPRRAQPPGPARRGAGGRPEREHGVRASSGPAATRSSSGRTSRRRHVQRESRGTFSPARTTTGRSTFPSRTPNAPETGDAWLGVFKSFDGGITWKSTLLPGYPQQVPRTGPLSTFTTAADPVVRAGTNGLFYYSGIAFNRDTKDGVVFVSRFMDLNNKENGDPTLDSDPIRYIDTKVVDSAAPSAPFIDKPWIAVDKPRLLDGVCNLTVPQPLPGNPNATVSQTVPAGSVYAAWTEATGTGSSLTTNVFFSSSRDCGGSWSRPVKLNGTNKVNQGASIAIDPATGVIYVVWRRFASGSQTDAIMMTRSLRGLLFSTPSVVVSLPAYNAAHPTAPSFFDQGTSTDSFRTNAYPTIGIDRRPDAGTEDDDEPDTSTFRGKVFVAWSQRVHGPERRRPDRPLRLDGRRLDLVGANAHRQRFADRRLRDLVFPRPPVHAADDGDGRQDHDHLLRRPPRPHVRSLLAPEQSAHAGPGHRKALSRDAPARGRASQSGRSGRTALVFTPFFVETGMTQWRHTIDLRFAQADSAVSPVFSSARLSQYIFGTRGDETEVDDAHPHSSSRSTRPT